MLCYCKLLCWRRFWSIGADGSGLEARATTRQFYHYRGRWISFTFTRLSYAMLISLITFVQMLVLIREARRVKK